jgi:putative ABC transport system permease protein
MRLLSWRHHRTHALRAFLGLASIALGVSLFVSVHTAQTSMAASFERTVRTLAGRAEWRATRGSKGIDLEAIAKMEATGAVVAPMLQVTTTFPSLNESTILILCVDFAREPKLRDLSMKGSTIDPMRLMLDPGAILVTRSLAARQKLAIGAAVKVNTPSGVKTVRVAGLVDDSGPASVMGGNIAVMGIGGAQRLFGRKDVDWIDGIGDVARVREALGPDYRVGPVKGKNSMLDLALERIQALVSVSIIALLVGLFIIYLSVSIGVVERTKEIGTMRAIGATRAQVLRLFLVEAAALGLVGSAGGVALGFGLARGLLAMVAEGVNTYVFVVDVKEIVLSPWLAAVAISIGTLTSLGAALVPSWTASTVSPMVALRPATMSMRSARRFLGAFAAGAALSMLTLAGYGGFYLKAPMWVGVAATGVTFLGAALMAPQVVLWLSQGFRALLSSVLRIEGYLAADNAMKYPQRTALTVIALGGALTMMVASAGMVASVRRSTDRWMASAFPFDLSVAANDMSQQVYSSASLPEEAVARVAAVPGVGEVYRVKSAVVDFRDTEIMIVAPEVGGWFEMMARKKLTLEGAPQSPEAIAAMERGESCVVSTNFAALHRTGDSVEIETPRGARRFRIAGAAEDFSWPKGVVILDLAVYRELWDDRSVTYIDIGLAAGANPADVKAAVGKTLSGDYRAFVHSAKDIEVFAHNVLDAAFSLTRAQVLIAVIIGFLGIVNTLLISVLRRTREIGLLRAIGMTRGQVARTVVIEAVWVAFWAALMGAALGGGVWGGGGGLYCIAFPIASSFLKITGYTLPFTVPWETMGMAAGAALVIGLVASAMPARRAARLNVLEAVGYE